jgi:hypothetical protein
MPRGKLSTKEVGGTVGTGIIATVEACRAVVAAFADGRITPAVPAGTRDADLRYAPRFARDSAHRHSGVKYTTGSISAYFLKEYKHNTYVKVEGKRTAPSLWMRLAMALLEAFEENWLDEESTLIFIAEERKGYGLNPLLKELQMQRTVHKILTEAKCQQPA